MNHRHAKLAETIQAALEHAGLSGLCREGQIELALQEARKLRPELSDEELIELVEIEAGD
tara:strand:+ start:1557 stop:1736 length:180 start_codon:yes stop_codon:yes gene_type:complete